MLKPNFLALLTCLLLLNSVSSAQRQLSGYDTIQTSRSLNEYTPLLSDAPVGTNEIHVADNQLNSNNNFNNNLKSGDLLLIIQMQGASIKAGEDNTWGTVLDYQGAGNQEWTEVQAVLPGGKIRLNCGLRYAYSTAGRTQIVRVPRFANLFVAAGVIVSCPPWDGAKGGIIALECNDSLYLASGSSIDASAAGFRGGSARNGSPEWGVYHVASPEPAKGAEKGEGIAGYADDYLAYGGKFCRGAAANGGGGGNAHNAGGGGGANGGLLSQWTGNGNPDTSIASWKQAWDLESASFSVHQSAGGGRGGYTFSSLNKDALTLGPTQQAWDGDWRRNTGGLGGRPLDDAGYRLFLGGGGGAGDANNNAGGSGGRGGGIIAIRSFGKISGTGIIAANGANGATAGSSTLDGKDGAGGGGGGGSILLETTKPVEGIHIQTRGGRGGNQDVMPFINEAEGPGGGGGGGRVLMANSPALPDVSGGANGTTDSRGLTEFPHNGATSGGSGSLRNIPLITGMSAVGDTLCTPAMAYLRAQPADGQEVFWTSHWGGPVLSDSLGLMVQVNSDTTFFLHSCYPVESIPVKVYFSAAALVDAGNDTSICKNPGIQLHASGNGTFSWTGEGIDQPGIQNPMAYPQQDAWYVVSMTDSNGCSSRDSVFVSLIEMTTPTYSIEQISNYEVRFWIDAPNSGQTYTWLMEDSVYTGDTCLHPFPFDGFFEATLVVHDSCGTDTTHFQLQVTKIASTGSQIQHNTLIIYPNPVSGNLYFKPSPASGSDFHYRIYDSSGRIVKLGKAIVQPTNSIDTSELPAGVYLLELQTDQYIYRAGFIRQTY